MNTLRFGFTQHGNYHRMALGFDIPTPVGKALKEQYGDLVEEATRPRVMIASSLPHGDRYLVNTADMGKEREQFKANASRKIMMLIRAVQDVAKQAGALDPGIQILPAVEPVNGTYPLKTRIRWGRGSDTIMQIATLKHMTEVATDLSGSVTAATAGITTAASVSRTQGVTLSLPRPRATEGDDTLVVAPDDMIRTTQFNHAASFFELEGLVGGQERQLILVAGAVALARATEVA